MKHTDTSDQKTKHKGIILATIVASVLFCSAYGLKEQADNLSEKQAYYIRKNYGTYDIDRLGRFASIFRYSAIITCATAISSGIYIATRKTRQ